MSALRHD